MNNMKRYVLLLFIICLVLNSTPVFASTPSSKFVKVSFLSNHGLLLKDDGTVWAWGMNDKGQLGDGTTSFRSSPVQVQGLPKIKEVLTGYSFSAVLGENGDVYTWGANDQGQLGTSSNNKFEKSPALAISGVSQISHIDGQEVLVLKADGTLWGWGRNMGGKDGAFGAGMYSYGPLDLSQDRTFIRLYSNYVTDAAGKVYQYTPTAKKYYEQPQLFNMRGANVNYVLLSDGFLYQETKPYQFIKFTSVKNVIEAASSGKADITLDASGNAWTWGGNGAGQIGNGKIGEDVSTPYKVLTNVESVAMSSIQGYAVKNDGSVWGWGWFKVGNDVPASTKQLTPKKLFDSGDSVSVSIPLTPTDSPTPMPSAPPVSTTILTDLSGHWAEAEIRSLVSAGIVNGYENNTFRPSESVTREQFIKLLVEALHWSHSIATSAFSDVTADRWSNTYVAAAIEHGAIVPSEVGSFLNPTQPLTRNEMAVMVARSLTLSGVSAHSGFVDQDQIGLFPELVQAVVDQGLLKGNTKNEFNPAGTTTRAESALLIYRLLQLKVS